MRGNNKFWMRGRIVQSDWEVCAVRHCALGELGQINPSGLADRPEAEPACLRSTMRVQPPARKPAAAQVALGDDGPAGTGFVGVCRESLVGFEVPIALDREAELAAHAR